MIDECHAVHGLSARHQHKGLGIFVVVKAGASDGYLFAAATVIRAQRNLGLGQQFSSVVGIVSGAGINAYILSPRLHRPDWLCR